MRRLLNQQLLLGCSLAISGCSPSVHDLLANRQYDEAMRVAYSERVKDRPLVERAIEHELDPAVHLAVVSREELVRMLGDVAGDLDGLRVVRFRARSNFVPSLASRFGAQLESAGELLPTVPLDSLEALATVTHEPPAPKDWSTEWIAVNIVTAGLPAATLALSDWLNRRSQPPSHAGKGSPAAPPPLDPNAAPRAARIRAAFDQHHDEATHGDRFVAWLKPPDEASPDVELTIECTVGNRRFVTRARLPNGRTLQERVATLFGSRERRLRELGDTRWIW